MPRAAPTSLAAAGDSKDGTVERGLPMITEGDRCIEGARRRLDDPVFDAWLGRQVLSAVGHVQATGSAAG